MRHSSIMAKGETAEILIYEDIGEGFFGGLGAKAFREQIAGLDGVSTLNVRINSDGGDVFDGMAIYNTLKEHPARKNVIVDGIAASMASVIAMAGDSITIQPTATMMIHNARGTFRGDCNALREGANLLEMINGQMAIAYTRSGLPTDAILAVMQAETWYTAQGAVEAGWADALVAQPLKMAASLKGFDLSGFERVPGWVKAAQAASEDSNGCTCPCEPCLGGDCAACDDAGCTCEGCTCDMAEGKQEGENAGNTARNAQKVLEIQQNTLVSAKTRERLLHLLEMS